MLTSCPECATTFRVTQEQLGVRRGMVRCGRCGAVFNAYDNLQAEIDAPAPIADPTPTYTPPPAPRSIEAAKPVEARPVEMVPTAPSRPPPAPTVPAPVEKVLVESHKSPASHGDEVFDSSWLDGMREDTLHIGVPAGSEDFDEGPRTRRLENIDDILLSELPGRRERAAAGDWGSPVFWLLALLLGVALLAQIAFFLRVELANWQPALRPIFGQACAAFGCRMPLGTDIASLRIEASSLETDPEQGAHARLRVTFSNRSAEPVEWPHFILKLSDVGNVAMAQRVFKPADYLGKGKPAAPHMAPRSEHEFHLDLDMGTLSAAGYEVKPYYP